MRFFTLLSSALLVAANAVAAPVSPRQHTRCIHSEAPRTEVQRADLSHRLSVTPSARPLSARSSVSSIVRKAPGAHKAPITDEIVSLPPAGTVSNWSRDCTGFMVFWGYIFQEDMYGATQQIIDGEDGHVYLNTICSTFPLPDSWVQADKADDGSITIPAGQMVYTEDYYGDIYDYCLVPLTYGYDDDDEYYEEFYDSYKFNLVDGKYVSDDPEVILGICEWIPDEDTWYWSGYGDRDITITPVTEAAVQLPSGVSAEKWAAITDEMGYFVDVAIDGAKLYVGGLYPACPDAYMVGDIDGDKVIFKAGQFLGATDDYSWAYLYGGKIDEIYDEDWEEYVPVATITGDLSFSYDAEAKKLTSDDAVIVTYNRADDLANTHAAGYIEEIVIEYQNRDPEALPAKPVDVYVEDYFEDYGDYDFYFTLSPFDVDGNVLDPACLYYRIYVDGEPFVFYQDEYPYFPEDGMELIPASFSDNDGIFKSGNSYCVYFYVEGIDTYGVQSVYLQPVEGGEPVELCSEIVTTQLGGIRDVLGSASSAASSTYFDLQGRRVSDPQPGLYIRRDVMTDGSVRTAKVAIK